MTVEEENTRRKYEAWASLDDRIAENFRPVGPFASEAVKAPMLIAGGSAAAMLALLSQVVKDSATYRPLIACTLHGVAWFGTALLLAALATGLTYLAQGMFSRAPALMRKIENHPWVDKTDASREMMRRGSCLRGSAMGLVLLSYAAITAGYVTIYFGFSRILGL